MSKLLSLLPPPTVFEEARGFIDSRFPNEPETLSFRIVPGPLHDMALGDRQKALTERFVQKGELISLSGQPPQPLSQSLCEVLGLLMTCQCPPKVEAIVAGGVTEDLTGLGYKAYTLEQWATLASASPEVFWAAVALVRLLEARAAGLKTWRSYVALAYQKDIPEGTSGDDLVSPTLDGLTEAGLKFQENPQGNE